MGHCELHRELELPGIRRGCCSIVHGALKRVGGASVTGQRLDLHSGFVCSLRQPRQPLLCMPALVWHGCFMYVDSFKDLLVTPPCH